MHEINYIHRDIKPENFCFGVDGERNVLYLIDFGLAKLFKNSKGEHIPLVIKKGMVG